MENWKLSKSEVEVSILEKMLAMKPYGLDKIRKNEILAAHLNQLTQHHYHHCVEYRNMLNMFGYQLDKKYAIEQIPFLPARLFKKYNLRSIEDDKIVRVIASSGTSGQLPAKINLDSATSRNQSKALMRIMEDFMGKSRVPIVILDTIQIKNNRRIFSARGAGTLGFSIFGKELFYALDENMEIDIDGLKKFIKKHNEEKIVLFGYTYIIWKYVIGELIKKGICLSIKEGLLFHSGGWKKLQNESVDASIYNRLASKAFGDIRVHNYYGMAEQLGSIFVECEYGFKHCSIFSDIIIRRAHDFSCAEFGERGLMELVSVLPTSYPGHVLLTEDEGEIVGEDDCPCGRLGKTFKIHGRIKNAEVRGCSDTYEQRS